MLLKLSPDRDLQCYFERPSAIAAISGASADGFSLTGTWRQQFDWAVVEWNRDNVFEHPLFRNLPDGDLSGLHLEYEEVRTNCIPVDSSLFPTVDWPFLRIWTDEPGGAGFYKVPLTAHATAVEGAYHSPHADFSLSGTLTPGDYVGLAWQDEQYNHLIVSGDSTESVLDAIAASINALSGTAEAERFGSLLRVHYVGPDATLATSKVGANGNRIGIYGFVSGTRSEEWQPKTQRFSGGTSPSKWRFNLDFSDLRDVSNNVIPTQYVRKMRWTYAADLQDSAYNRSEFAVNVSNWVVTGSNRAYRIAGPGSVRIEDDSAQVSYSGSWETGTGNFSGGSLRYCTTPGCTASVNYNHAAEHVLYLGSRYAGGCGEISVVIDGGAPIVRNLAIAGEDVLARVELAPLAAGSHTVTITHSGAAGTYVYFDFLEVARPTVTLPAVPVEPQVTLATDWDTDHSIALPAERTAWMIHSMGFHGRVNHYVGALWFYELYRKGHQYASATVSFTGTPTFSEITTVTIGRTGVGESTTLTHLNLIGETASDVAKAFELVINSGYTGIRAEAVGGDLHIYSRSMGADGNYLTLAASTGSSTFLAAISGTSFTGGIDGEWRTDLAAVPRLNRAVRDWSRRFLQKIQSYGMDAACAFSMELQHGDPDSAVGIAQRYPSGNAVLLNTPALQTNFSPISREFWKQVYLDMATVMVEAGITPYLQFGEVQWWYFPYDGSGLPFHDDYTRTRFEAAYGFPIRPIPDGYVSPATYPEEAALLPVLIGEFTDFVMSYVRTHYPSSRFEVLYPTDVNEGAMNRVVNFAPTWDAPGLTCLKTESFIYTYARNLDRCSESMRFSATKNYGREQRSHLVGISDAISPWRKETMLAKGEGLESVVLFALDQFCLIGYSMPIGEFGGRSLLQG